MPPLLFTGRPALVEPMPPVPPYSPCTVSSTGLPSASIFTVYWPLPVKPSLPLTNDRLPLALPLLSKTPVNCCVPSAFSRTDPFTAAFASAVTPARVEAP
ncbi:hypothetical protein GCM10025868_34190 [Angustibacter aerolatus]|uniref:Uncharacterized protein n=1 Tax=Angustibacter aerolatus TaxID=1162965 RepID=A0ABQ6JJV9_9ACTN|nr:hypothetical protein GCM10025868_34190 [Angustibacter aerolatus]